MEKSIKWYNEKYQNSTEYHKPGTQSIYIPLWREVLATIAEYNVKRVLDLGCGPGQFLEYVLSTNIDLDYTGIDFSPEAIQLATAKNLPGSFTCRDIFTLKPAEYAKYDAILLLEVLEHLDNDLKLLAGIQGKLLICTVPNFTSVSHVRWFNDINAVRSRYSKVLTINNITAIPHTKRQTFFLFNGKTKTTDNK